MTFEDKCKELMTSHGLWPDEANAIMEVVKADDKTMFHRWRDDVDGYPTSMMAVIWMTVKHTALDWLKKNKPMHWAIPMFDPNDPIHKEADVETAKK